MIYREATTDDIHDMMTIRLNVRENMLSDPNSISFEDVDEHLTTKGQGWVCIFQDEIVGFSVIDLSNDNFWALFVRSDAEGRGIGSRLHDLAVNWYFDQTKRPMWLGTDPNTRAEAFYRKKGWIKTGERPNGEHRFVMPKSVWDKHR